MAHEIINNFRAKISIEFCCTNNYHLVWISVLNFFSHLACSTYLKLRFAEKATKNCRNFPFIFDTKGVSVCKPCVVFHEKTETVCSHFYESQQKQHAVYNLRHLYLVTPNREISSKFLWSTYMKFDKIGEIFPDGAVFFLCNMVSMRYFINFHTSVVSYRIYR